MPARLSSTASLFIRETFPEEDQNLGHVRRFVTEDSYSVPKEYALDQGKPATFLRMMVCTQDYMDDQKEVEELLKPLIQVANHFEIKPKKPKNGEPPGKSVFVDLFYEAKVQERTTARHAPETKQESVEWGQKTGWPLMWRGNTAAIPTDMTTRDQDQALKYLALVVKEAIFSDRGIATIIVDPEIDSIISTATDACRDSKNPLKHCVMEALEKAAEWRQALTEDDGGYLCRGYHVYTTHEPCAMCAMALLHSRISRLVYVQNTPTTGAIEPESSGLCIHAQAQLNWQYEAWKYSGSKTERIEDLGETDHVRPIPGYNV